MNRREKEKYLENFEMWLGRKMEVIKWTDKVRNKEGLRRVGQDLSVKGNQEPKKKFIGS